MRWRRVLPAVAVLAGGCAAKAPRWAEDVSPVADPYAPPDGCMALVELPAEVAALEPLPPAGQPPAEVQAGLAELSAEIARQSPQARCHPSRRGYRDSMVLLCTPEPSLTCTSAEQAIQLIEEIRRHLPPARVRLDCPCVTEGRRAR